MLYVGNSNCWSICCFKSTLVVNVIGAHKIRGTQNCVFLFTLWLFCLRYLHIVADSKTFRLQQEKNHNISTWHYVIIVCLLGYITCVPHYTIVYMLVIWFSLRDYFSILTVVSVLIYCWIVSQFLEFFVTQNITSNSAQYLGSERFVFLPSWTRKFALDLVMPSFICYKWN